MGNRLPLAAALCLGLAPAAAASDLLLNGQPAVSAPLNSNLNAVLTGAPGKSALILVDASAGPVVIGGESVPLGFTNQVQILAQGVTGGNGSFSAFLNVPNQPGLAGVQVFTLGVILDDQDPNGLDFSAAVPLSIFDPLATPTEVELAGVPRSGAPFFSWVQNFRQGDSLRISIDPNRFPGLVGQTVDIYVVADKSQGSWQTSPGLFDLSGDGVNSLTVSGLGVPNNIINVDAGTLSGDALASLGRRYDVVVDVNRNGSLDAPDLIDGYSGAGLFICRDPSLAGPYTVVETLYSGGSLLGQDLYYPSNIANLSNVPIVVVSHGNGHNYQWYDHIGNHLASYGYVVMSHQNNTVPGIETASTTTLTNTDYLLGNLATIAGGVLLGRVDVNNITWIGHSRGGEGVARAYDRIIDGTFVPANFGAANIRLISSMAPTDFLGTNSANPHGENYHLWVATADADVSGCVSSDITQSYHLLSRATNQRQSIAIYGAGHGDLHDGGGSSVASGPCLIGRSQTHQIMRGYLLPLVEFHARNNPAGKEFLTRQYKDLWPQAVPVTSNPCIGVTVQFREASQSGKLVIDDFEAPASLFSASSGATVSSNLLNRAIGRLDDPNNALTFVAGEAMNGMSQCNASDPEFGTVFRFDGSTDFVLSYGLIAGQTDWSQFRTVSMRVCQSTRDPFTVGELSDANFSVRLVDQDGDSAELRVLRVAQGIEEPYQRTGCGAGSAGWANEFETVRIGFLEFQTVEPNLDLDRMAKLELVFGPSHGSTAGALGLDDLELNRD
jgi:hypothetical protein